MKIAGLAVTMGGLCAVDLEADELWNNKEVFEQTNTEDKCRNFCSNFIYFGLQNGRL